jgi:hypothetical protein
LGDAASGLLYLSYIEIAATREDTTAVTRPGEAVLQAKALTNIEEHWEDIHLTTTRIGRYYVATGADRRELTRTCPEILMG